MTENKLETAKNSITEAVLNIDAQVAEATKAKADATEISELESMSSQLTGMVGRLSILIAKSESSSTDE